MRNGMEWERGKREINIGKCASVWISRRHHQRKRRRFLLKWNGKKTCLSGKILTHIINTFTFKWVYELNKSHTYICAVKLTWLTNIPISFCFAGINIMLVSVLLTLVVICISLIFFCFFPSINKYFFFLFSYSIIFCVIFADSVHSDFFNRPQRIFLYLWGI